MSIIVRSLVFSLTLGLVGFGFVPGIGSEAQAFWLFDGSDDADDRGGKRKAERKKKKVKKERRNRGKGKKGRKRAVPELDPNVAVQAVALLAGGTYLVLRRRREA